MIRVIYFFFFKVNFDIHLLSYRFQLNNENVQASQKEKPKGRFCLFKAPAGTIVILMPRVFSTRQILTLWDLTRDLKINYPEL